MENNMHDLSELGCECYKCRENCNICTLKPLIQRFILDLLMCKIHFIRSFIIITTCLLLLLLLMFTKCEWLGFSRRDYTRWERVKVLLADAPIFEVVTITDMEGLLDISSIVENFRIIIKAWIITAHNPRQLVDQKINFSDKNTRKIEGYKPHPNIYPMAQIAYCWSF